tara:strand:+ start:1059 stop:1661 length:603 start_codon:yes stop_codon:yes gene_type:complete
VINFESIDPSDPFIRLQDLYDKSLSAKQKNIEAICISSYNNIKKEVTSRYVNIKFIRDNKLFFFSNYNSPKAIDFQYHDQIAGNIFWNSIDTQIRIKATINKISNKESDYHFANRAIEKNALAISSFQSRSIDSYESVIKKYEITLGSLNKNNYKRPEYWGGFSIKPYYFEFWHGNPNRLNERYAYHLLDGKWSSFILEP